MHITVTLVRLGDQRLFIASRPTPTCSRFWLRCCLAQSGDQVRNQDDDRPVARQTLTDHLPEGLYGFCMTLEKLQY